VQFRMDALRRAMTKTPGNASRLLRLPDVQDFVGLRRSEIYRRVKLGTFPRPIRLGVNAVAWPQAEIEAWVAEKVARSRTATS
jgi:prophage regulatory protein